MMLPVQAASWPSARASRRSTRALVLLTQAVGGILKAADAIQLMGAYFLVTGVKLRAVVDVRQDAGGRGSSGPRTSIVALNLARQTLEAACPHAASGCRKTDKRSVGIDKHG
jgi:hypothetical protein